jgi:hypothetical protein
MEKIIYGNHGKITAEQRQEFDRLANLWYQAYLAREAIEKVMEGINKETAEMLTPYELGEVIVDQEIKYLVSEIGGYFDYAPPTEEGEEVGAIFFYQHNKGRAALKQTGKKVFNKWSKHPTSIY